jgi:hypothetical protein
MARVRNIHIRRYADIVMGSTINGAKTKVQKLALKRAIDVSEGRTAFNEQIRNNTPSIYLVDPDLIAQIIVAALSNPQTSNRFILGVFTPSGLSSAGNADFNTQLANLAPKLQQIEKVLAEKIRKELYDSFKTITVTKLSEVVENIYNKLIQDMETAAKLKRKYISYQTAAAKAGSELRRVLNSLKIAILEKPEEVITNVGTRVTFVSYAFTAGVGNINKIIQSAVDGVLKNYISTTDKFNVGNLVNAGHVGLYSDEGLVGINMPSGLIAGLVSNKFEEIESALGSIPIHIQQGLKLSTNYTAKAGMFLDLQFNFVVSMESGLNSQILGPLEQAAIKQVVGSITNEALVASIKQQLSETSIIELTDSIGASPSMQEYIETLISNTIKGKKTPAQAHNVPINLITDVTRGAFKPRNKTTAKVHASSQQKISAPTKADSVTVNLTNLQSLINRHLQSVIAANMGDGGQSSILNYQTGRFAASAKVERLTQSREGMITAFYSYMKNPYQTFEPGYRQGSPKTRDPKLLIARSIREIAETRVSNKLRAVSI